MVDKCILCNNLQIALENKAYVAKFHQFIMIFFFSFSSFAPLFCLFGTIANVAHVLKMQLESLEKCCKESG
jgi:hypothetical protein